jgi:hypothetical protein
MSDSGGYVEDLEEGSYLHLSPSPPLPSSSSLSPARTPVSADVPATSLSPSSTTCTSTTLPTTAAAQISSKHSPPATAVTDVSLDTASTANTPTPHVAGQPVCPNESARSHQTSPQFSHSSHASQLPPHSSQCSTCSDSLSARVHRVERVLPQSVRQVPILSRLLFRVCVHFFIATLSECVRASE